MNYSKEIISQLCEYIKNENAGALNYLLQHNAKELLLMKDAVLGDGKALEALIKINQLTLASFVNAVREDSKAFELLLKQKAFHWAAVANLINGDKKAALWLKKNNMEHYAMLGIILLDKIQKDGDDGMMRSIMRGGSPY